MKVVYKFLFIIVVVFVVSNCARTGRPEGGPKDENAPLFVTANPAYETVNFNKKEIRLNFDEFIVLKDLNKQLLISPPMKYPPIITPQGSASKFINIEIKDTLNTNSTYIFNFGNAIQDNNEGNKLENFKYVFSTGNYIDSLTISGSIKDAKLLKTPKEVNVLLYKLDSTFNDSIIYKNKPNYITSTLDTTNFNFTNIKKGKYLMLALKEPLNDYIFNPKTDKIGFIKDTIQLPKDSIINKPIILFKEEQPYEFKRGKEVTKGKIEFGFQGDAKDMKVNLLSNVPEEFKSIAKFDVKKDTLNYWFTPFEADSLNFIIENKEFRDTLTVQLRKNKIDSLILNTSTNKILNFRDTFSISSNNPIIKIDSSKISFFNKDTLAVKFNMISSKKENKIAFIFDKQPKEKYNIKMLPSAFTDIFNVANDSLDYKFSTNEISDYGRISMNINNVNSKNLIIELLTGAEQNELVERQFVNSSSKVIFDLLPPGNYTVKAIIDENKNNKWDTGNYLKKRLPEKIIYNDAINNYELRANFFVEENFIFD